MKKKNQTQQLWIALVVLCVTVVLALAVPALGLVILFLVLNTGTSYLKRFTAAAPIDIEFLAVGGAILSQQSVGYGLLLAIIGPLLGEYVQGGIGQFVWVKMVCVVITVLCAAFMGPSAWGLLGAVIIGLVVQYFIMFAMTKEAVMNFMRRATNALFSAYVLFFALPLIQ